MSKSTPSLLALLGLVAYAGYQNRDKIGDMMADSRQSGSAGSDGHRQGGFLADIGQKLQAGLSGTDMSGSGMAGGGIAGARGDLVSRFRASGRGDVADSWVSTEANRPMAVDDLGVVLGQDTLDELVQKTGLSQQELLLRLNASLPEVVDSLTPDGRLPAADAPGSSSLHTQI